MGAEGADTFKRMGRLPAYPPAVVPLHTACPVAAYWMVTLTNWLRKLFKPMRGCRMMREMGLEPSTE